MLDIIQTQGTPLTRDYFLVEDTNYRAFVTPNEGKADIYNQIAVAAVNYDPDGKMRDWAAYHGIVPRDWSRAEKLETVARFGEKLSVRDVKFFLFAQPDLSKLLKRYRE